MAERRRPGARLSVRFGALPTTPCEPGALLLDTLAGTGWRATEVKPAGTPPRWRRQAEQFEQAGTNGSATPVLPPIP